VCVAEKEKFHPGFACRYFRAGKPKLSRQELTYHMHMVNRNEVIIVCCVCSARPVLASSKRKDSVCKATTGPGPLARDHQIRSNRLVLTSYFFLLLVARIYLHDMRSDYFVVLRHRRPLYTADCQERLASESFCSEGPFVAKYWLPRTKRRRFRIYIYKRKLGKGRVVPPEPSASRSEKWTGYSRRCTN
jgi:hypothetical protein